MIAGVEWSTWISLPDDSEIGLPPPPDDVVPVNSGHDENENTINSQHPSL